MGMPTIGTGVLKLPVGSNTRPPFPVKPFLAACGEEEWLVVDKSRGKLRTAEPQSPEVPMGKDTHSPTTSTSSKGDDSASYTDKMRAMKIKYERNFEKEKRRKYNTWRQIWTQQPPVYPFFLVPLPLQSKIYIMASPPVPKDDDPPKLCRSEIPTKPRLHHKPINSPKKSDNRKDKVLLPNQMKRKKSRPI